MSVTAAKIFAVINVYRRVKRWREARKLRKAFERGDYMDIKQFATQAVLGLLRHAMTASPLAAMLVSEDQLTVIAAGIVGFFGMLWSWYRKYKAAQG